MVRRIWVSAGVALLLGAGLGADAANAAPVTAVPTIPTDTTANTTDVGSCATSGGSCSLREAVNYVQNNAGGGTVDLTETGIPSYSLSKGTLVINVASGNPTISITGPNPRLVTITASGASPAGGVMTITGATVTISGVTITGGSATGNGGGILNNAVLTLNNDQITNNTATAASLSSAAGGGVYNNTGTLTISNTTINSNTATGGGSGSGASGGGIASMGGTLYLTNSTIAANTASGGTPIGSASGGGIAQLGAATIVLANVTLNGNTASNTLANATAGNLSTSGSGSVSAKDTIISGGTANGGSNCNAATAATSQGYNLEDKNQCGFAGTGDKVNTDPRLNALANSPTGNGFTDVETVNIASPVIDGGNPNGCTDAVGAALSTDQVANPRGKPCDIGAFESNLPPVLTTGPVVSGIPQTGQVLTCSGASFSGLPYTLSYAWLRNGTAIAGATGPMYTPAGPDVGQGVACSVTATNVDGTLTATSTAVTISLPPLPPFDGMTLLKTRFTLTNSQVVLPVQCSKVAIFGCGGLVKISVASANATAAAKKKRKHHHAPSVPHPTTLGTATFKFNTAVIGSIPVLISHDAKLEIASRPHGQQAVTIQFLSYDGLYRQKVTTYSGRITAPASTVSKKHKKKRKR